MLLQISLKTFPELLVNTALLTDQSGNAIQLATVIETVKGASGSAGPVREIGIGDERQIAFGQMDAFESKT